MSETENKYEIIAKSGFSNQMCIHCGDPCGTGCLQDGNNFFCCSGCRSVYKLLNDIGLDEYYVLTDNPGLKPDFDRDGNRFEFLDNTDIIQRLIDYNDGAMCKIRLFIPQIHCASCIWLLENLFKLNDEISSSIVDFPRRQLSVSFNIKRYSLRQLVTLLASLGYEPELKILTPEDRPKNKSNRKLYARMAVAGFGFGNVMLLSFPEYLGFEPGFKDGLGMIIGYLIIILSVPVVFFSAAEFIRPAFISIRQKQLNMDVPIAIGIIVIFLQSIYNILQLNQAGYMDSLCALIFLLLLGRLYQKKTYFSMKFERDYNSYLPIFVNVKRDGFLRAMSLDNLKIGDRIVMRNQEIIPADSILIKGRGRIDYSFVTGESNPILIKSGDLIYAGGRQVGESIELEIIKSPSGSYLIQLWEQAKKVVSGQPQMTTLANRISRIFTPAVLSLALITAIFWLFIEPARAGSAAAAVLIIACPCALALSAPFTLGTAQRLMGRSRLFLKDSAVIEKMSRLTSIIFDKTGTITQAGASKPVFEGAKLNSEQRSMIFSLVKQSTHPLSISLATSMSKYENLPLNNFVERRGFGLKATINGHEICLGSHKWVGLEHPKKQNFTAVYVSIDNDILGYFRFSNLFRQGLKEVICLLEKDYKMALLTGDNDSEKEKISGMFGKKSGLHFNQSPHDKLSFVASLIENGEQAAMIGDGLNDAGALKTASVGITIAENDSSFSPACDGILMASNFNLLPQFFQLSKDCLKIIKISYAISILYNVIGLVFAVQGLLSPVIAAVLMPVSSITVVLFTTLAVTLSAGRRGLFK